MEESAGRGAARSQCHRVRTGFCCAAEATPSTDGAGVSDEKGCIQPICFIDPTGLAANLAIVRYIAAIFDNTRARLVSLALSALYDTPTHNEDTSLHVLSEPAWYG